MRTALLLVLMSGCSSPLDELDALTQDVSCTSDGDCCVVMESCSASVFVVGKADLQEAKDLAADARDDEPCLKCGAPPPVDLRCNPGTRRCEGRQIDVETAPEGLSVDHCGSLVTDPWPDESAAIHALGCGEG